MNRRQFGGGLLAASASVAAQDDAWKEPARTLPVRRFDVVVAGGGTAGVVAALAAARNGARTALVEWKGYTGGTVVEGGTALHSYYNLWKAFPGVARRHVIRGIPQEIVDRLVKAGGASGHVEMSRGYDYDSVCTAIDTEIYKLVSLEMLEEAGVALCLNTMVAGAIRKGTRLEGAIAESRQGREAFAAAAFIDATAYGDLAAHAGAKFTVPDDYASCNSIALANVSLAKLRDFLKSNEALEQEAESATGQIVRLQGRGAKLPPELSQGLRKLGASMVTTTVHDGYFMFIKVNYKVPGGVLDRDAVSRAEVEIRRRQAKTVELFRRFVPGCETAFITRTSPALNIRRGRLIECDYDIALADVVEARHFDDDVYVYGFHDSAPRLQIRNGGTYGVPYRALRVKGVDNLLATGMMITSDHEAHMSTRNTVSSMAMGQAAGTAAALCAKLKCGTRELKYTDLRAALSKGGVYFEG